LIKIYKFFKTKTVQDIVLFLLKPNATVHPIVKAERLEYFSIKTIS